MRFYSRCKIFDSDDLVLWKEACKQLIEIQPSIVRSFQRPVVEIESIDVKIRLHLRLCEKRRSDGRQSASRGVLAIKKAGAAHYERPRALQPKLTEGMLVENSTLTCFCKEIPKYVSALLGTNGNNKI